VTRSERRRCGREMRVNGPSFCLRPRAYAQGSDDGIREELRRLPFPGEGAQNEAYDPLRVSAQHTAGDFDNRHVEIVCAASARVNVSVLYQFVDTANRTWPTWRGSAAGISGRAARGSVAPRKMACRPPAGAGSISGSRPSTRARGAAWSLPLHTTSGFFGAPGCVD
jgi:hypothetical protein